MKIYLRTVTASRGGEKLRGNLRHLDKYIQTALAEASFTSSFDTLSISLHYPPMYTHAGAEGTEMDFKKYYDVLPHLRLDRKQKRIEISLRAPEISELQDKEEQAKYDYKLDIGAQYKNIDETVLAKLVIHRVIEAGELIAAKSKKEDRFPLSLFQETLIRLEESVTAGQLAAANTQQAENVNSDRLSDAIAARDRRSKENKPQNTPIRDLRVYFPGVKPKTLYPYDYQYSAIFLQKLKEANLQCPGYHHLYIQVGSSKEAALVSSPALEDWYVNGIAVLDLDAYEKQTEPEKAQTVFNLIVEGLMDIARIDKLDPDKINSAIAAVREKGLDTELTFRIVDHKNYTLIVTWITRSIEEGSPIFFNLLEKKTRRIARIHIGNATHFQIHLWLQKITLTNKQIKVRSSGSITAGVWLEGKPMSMDFDIAEILAR